MALYKITNILGYFISAVMGVLWLSVIGLLWGVILYPITIILRGVGWASVAKEFNKRYFFITSITIIAGGFLLYAIGLNVLPIPGMSIDTDIPKLQLLAKIWIAYSLVELVSYGLMIKHSKIFAGAMSSIVGIVVIISFLQVTITDVKDFVPFVSEAVPFLVLSAILAGIGFAKLKAPTQS